MKELVSLSLCFFFNCGSLLLILLIFVLEISFNSSQYLLIWTLRTVLPENQEKLEMKIYNPPFIFSVKLGYLGE